MQEKAWSDVGAVLGYPENWMQIIRANLQQKGKSWDWKEEREAPRSAYDAPVVIIDAETPVKQIKNAILRAEQNETSISVVYTARPPLVSETRKSGEVDEQFSRELGRGRAILDSVENEARKMGVHIKTSFVWANSREELLDQSPNAQLITA